MAAFSTIALVAVAASAGVSAMSAIQSGNAQRTLAGQQAGLLEQDATQARLIAESDERDYRRQTSFMLASRRAGLGGQGVRSEGTPELVDESIVAESELQALRIRTGGKIEDQRMRQQAALTRQGGVNAQTAGYARAGASLLSGIGDGWGMSNAMKAGAR